MVFLSSSVQSIQLAIPTSHCIPTAALMIFPHYVPQAREEITTIVIIIACLYFNSCLHEGELTDSRPKDAKGTSASLSHWLTRASKCKSSTSLFTTLPSLKSSMQSRRNILGVSFLFLSPSQRWHDSLLITSLSIPLSPQSMWL
jgi:hypothetical protein